MRRRVEHAAALVVSRVADADVFVTERPGHARELTHAAIGRGASLVVAWGGDGTVNEVASALAFQNASLAIVPSGSGNGLARELGIPCDHRAALDVALGAGERTMDAGELDGRLFFNIAGCGLDARIARQFAEANGQRRGFVRYLEIAAREIAGFQPDEYLIVVDGMARRARPLIVAFANARQYGNGAMIAPSVCIDDGRLDVVVVGHRSPWLTLMQAPRLFLGQIGRVSDVTMTPATEVELSSPQPVLCHVAGEPHLGGRSVKVRVRPRALKVRCSRQ